MSALESIGYFFVWIGTFVVSLWKSILSVLNWFTPVIDFLTDTFDFLPSWVLVLMIACIAIEIVIFILNLGGE